MILHCNSGSSIQHLTVTRKIALRIKSVYLKKVEALLTQEYKTCAMKYCISGK